MNIRGLHRWAGELGALGTALYVLHRGLQAISGGAWRVVPYRFFAQPIGRKDRPALRVDPATWIGLLSSNDPLSSALPRPPAVIAARFAVGALCYAATVKGRFAGTIWIARGHYDEDEVRCRYELADPASCAWDYDVFVDPGFRLGRTMARLWQHVDAELAADGVCWSFSRISMFNAASVASHARLGARPTGWSLFLCLSTFQVAISSLRPHFHCGVRNGPHYCLPNPTITTKS